MSSRKLLALVTGLFSFYVCGAQNVNYLKYKYFTIEEEKKQKKEPQDGGIEFLAGGNVLQVKKTYGTYPLPVKSFDKEKGVVVFDYQNTKEYIIEQLDSLYGLNTRVEATGEKQVINGYNCELYDVEANRSFSGAGIYGSQTKSSDYTFSVWITNDISADESFSPYIASCLTGNVARFTFDGVIVKIDFFTEEKEEKVTKGTTMLDTATANAESAKEYVFPWKSSDDYVALLPDVNTNTPGLRYTNESAAIQFRRMKKLLITITGNQDPKFKTRSIAIAVQ